MICVVVTARGAVGYLHTGNFWIGWEETRGSFQLTVYTLPPASAGWGFEWRMLLRTTVSHIYSMAWACIHSPRRLYYSQKKLIKISHASYDMPPNGRPWFCPSLSGKWIVEKRCPDMTVCSQKGLLISSLLQATTDLHGEVCLGDVVLVISWTQHSLQVKCDTKLMLG